VHRVKILIRYNRSVVLTTHCNIGTWKLEYNIVQRLRTSKIVLCLPLTLCRWERKRILFRDEWMWLRA